MENGGLLQHVPRSQHGDVIQHLESRFRLRSSKDSSKDASASFFFSFFFFLLIFVPNNEVPACGKEGNLLNETPSVLLARMVRQQDHPKLFMAGFTATATASTHLRERRSHDLPQHPSHQPAGLSASRVYRLKNMGHPFSNDHGVMGPGLFSSSCQVAACTRPFQLAFAAKMACLRANNACQLMCHHCHLVAPYS